MTKKLFKLVDTQDRYLLGYCNCSLKVKFKNLKHAQVNKPDELSPLADPECKIKLVRELADDVDLSMALRYEIIRCRTEDEPGTCLNRVNPKFRSDQDFTEEQTDRMDAAKNKSSEYVLRHYYANREATLRKQMLRRIRYTGIVYLKPSTVDKYNITPEDIDEALRGYLQNN